MTCDLSAYRYSNHSRFKYDVAKWHLLQFERALDMVPTGAMFFRFGEEHPLAAVWGHADGFVLQLHAAFDAWACGLAHRCGWDSSDRRYFRELAGTALGRKTEMKATRRVIDPILESPEWRRLVELRNRSAHRTIVGGSLRLRADEASVAYFETDAAWKDEGTEVLPTLLGLARWAEGPLWWLWEVAEVWRKRDELSVVGTHTDRYAQRSGAAERLRRQLFPGE